MPRIALVTTPAARELDEDLAPLCDALIAAHAEVSIVDWDDATIDWAAFDLAVLRSPWDYTERLEEFLAWAERASELTRVLNPLDVIRWNTDKHYLADLERAGIAIVPSRFIEPGQDATSALISFLDEYADSEEFVIKPAVGAGSRDAQRHARGDLDSATAHIERLLDAQRSVLLQPYLASVDDAGETALIHFNGEFSHAIRKGPLLRPGVGSTDQLFAPEQITPRVAAADERELAARTLSVLPFGGALAYARVDLIRASDGSPVVLELELTEPSLFFAQADGAAMRYAKHLVAYANAQGDRT